MEGLVGLLHTLDHGLLSLSHPHTRIVELLVGVSRIGGGTDLLLQVVLVLLVVGADSVPEGPLGIGIDVHLDNTGSDGSVNLLGQRTTASVEDEHDGLVLGEVELLLDVLLGLAEDLRVQLDVTGSVHSVDVTEGSSDGEAGSDLTEGGVHLVDILGLGVQAGVLDTAVVDSVLLSSSHTNLHLQEDSELVAALEVLAGDGQVVLHGLGGQINHVGRVESSASLLEVLLRGIEATVEPGEQLLGAVVGVEDDSDSVGSSHGMHVLGSSHASEDGVALGLVGLQALSGEEGSTSVGELDDDGGVHGSGGLEASVDGVSGGAVDGGDGEAVLLSVLEELHGLVSGEDARMKE